MQHLDCGNPPESKYARLLAVMAKNDCNKVLIFKQSQGFVVAVQLLVPLENGKLVNNSEKLKCGDHKSFVLKVIIAVLIKIKIETQVLVYI